MTKHLILAALIASIAILPSLAEAKGGHKAAKAPTVKVEKAKAPKKG